MATFADNSVANFFFSLAMATKMVAAWSAALSPDVSLDFVSGNIRTLRKTELTVSLGTIH